MQDFVDERRKESRRSNTAKVFDPKTLEFEQFCEHVCGQSHYKCTVDAEKCYKSMFYQAHREQKKRGGKRQEAKPKFNSKECDALMAPFNNAASIAPLPTPKKPVGTDMFNQHRQTVKQIHTKQVQKGVNWNSLGVCVGWQLQGTAHAC